MKKETLSRIPAPWRITVFDDYQSLTVKTYYGFLSKGCHRFCRNYKKNVYLVKLSTALFVTPVESVTPVEPTRCLKANLFALPESRYVMCNVYL